MTGTQGRCEYVFDPTDSDTWAAVGRESETADTLFETGGMMRGQTEAGCCVGEEELNEDGVWSCPHEADRSIETTRGSTNLCLFHLPVSKKADTAVTDRLRELLMAEVDTGNDDDGRRLDLIGARLGAVDLSGETLADGGISLNLKHARITGPFRATQSDLEMTVVADGAQFEDRLDFTGARLGRDLLVRQAVVAGEFSVANVSLARDLDVRLSDLQAGANLVDATVGRHAKLGGSTISGDVSLETPLHSIRRLQMDVGQENMAGGLNLLYATIEGDLRCPSVTVDEPANFYNATIHGSSTFERATFRAGANFREVTIPGAVFRDARVPGGQFFDADLSDADFTNADLSGASFERAALNRAILTNADLREVAFSSALTGDARINEGTQFGAYCVYDPKSDAEPTANARWIEQLSDPLALAAEQYRTIEELARTNALPDLVSRSFVRRQEIHRYQHGQAGRRGRWLRATAARAVLLYGESPWRVMAWSLGIIVAFAVAFPIGGWMRPAGGAPITYSEIVTSPLEFMNSLYYSTLTFTALGFGDFRPVGFGRALTTLETGLGAVLLALLVWVFGRRAAR
ncbi:pentapeptide repeat-containing protein [Halorarius halobius]|uniref:pentapeptide repeat-containing protein n=1 Tax=Halorarius halobius TaxID=2962671 RepID=UPI0020CEBDE5|nr:pentapeptide repeat-containing protein [Halorarius halobius]